MHVSAHPIALLLLLAAPSAIAAVAGYGDSGEPEVDVSSLAKEAATAVFVQRDIEDARWLLVLLASTPPGTVAGYPVQGLRLCPCLASDPQSAASILAITTHRWGHRGSFTPVELQVLRAIIEELPGWRASAPNTPEVLAIEASLRAMRDFHEVTTCEALRQRYALAEAIHWALGEGQAFQESPAARRLDAQATALRRANAPDSEPPADEAAPSF